MELHTQRCHDSFKAWLKDQGVGGGPNPGNLTPFCPQSFSASGSFPVSQLFASGGPSIGVSASASIPPMNIQDWFPLGWTGWISLQSKGLSRVFSNTIFQKHQFFGVQLSLFWVSVINFTITSMITKTKCSLFPKFSDRNHFIIPESGFPMKVQWFLSHLKPIIMPHSDV